jgi:hypothetical protein
VPVITWATPAAITFGTKLGATQLHATASVPGTFVYSPAAGTVLTAGSQTLSVTFTPTDGVHYAPATASVTLVVHQAKPKVTWAAPAAITYPTPLSATQLDATASVPGTFTYTPAAGAVLGGGSHKLAVVFTPTDAVDYSAVNATVNITVHRLATAVTVQLSSPSTYGAENTQIGVTVDAVGASPAGKVTLKATPSAGVAITLCTATVSAGVGSCRPAANKLNAGSYTITGTFAATPNLAGSTSPAVPLVVQREVSTLTGYPVHVPSTGIATATFSATLTAGNHPLSGQPVVFTLGGATCTGITSTTGLAKCPMTVTAPVPPNYTAVYKGNSNIVGASALPPVTTR